MRTFPSVLDIPDGVELAVIAVAAPFVARVADECGSKRVRAIIVISERFSEAGPEGASRERELREISLRQGMRLLAPNCIGVINTDPTIKLNATISPAHPPKGNVAFLSRGGALGLVVLYYAGRLNIGMSSFVSVGNRADIWCNDLLRYWEEDLTTRVVVLYLESFGNPRKLGRIARRVVVFHPKRNIS